MSQKKPAGTHKLNYSIFIMILAIIAIIVGLVLLVWSADLFVDGAAGLARYFGMPPLLIGMVIVGFGTSAPEMAVSALSALQGNPELALGNAYGSNIANIALILGFTAVLSPIAIHSRVLRKELPILSIITALAAYQIWDGNLSRGNAIILLLVFSGVMVWMIYQGVRQGNDILGEEIEQELAVQAMPVKQAIFWLTLGLGVLVLSSRLLVWGAVAVALGFGVSELVIGLTIVAIGTSLPELASSVMAVRKGEHDIALGNVLGSNLFNTLVVVGIAGVIHPLAVSSELLARDVPVMAFLTVSLFLFGYGFRGPGRINRLGGVALLAMYASYLTILVISATQNGA